MALFKTFLLPVFLLLGTVGNGWLGIKLANADQPTISEVIPNSPAAAAGLKMGDIIKTVDGKAVATAEALVEAVREKNAGDELTLGVMRGTATMDVKVRLAERQVEGREPPKAEQREVEKPGSVAQASGYLGLEIEESQGGEVIVTDIVAGAPASKSELRRGDRLQVINGKTITSLADLDAAIGGIKVSDVVNMVVTRNGSRRKVAVVAGARPGAKPIVEGVVKGKKMLPPGAKLGGKKSIAPPTKSKARPRVTQPLSGKTETKVEFSTDLKKSMAAAKESKRPLMVVFGAEWCVNCTTLKKAFEHASLTEALGGYELVWIDTDRQSALADEYKVESLPHTIFMTAKGKARKTLVGYQPPEILLPALMEGLSSSKGKKRVGGQLKTLPKQKKASGQMQVQAAKVRESHAQESKGEHKESSKESHHVSELESLRREVQQLRKEQAATKELLERILRELREKK